MIKCGAEYNYAKEYKKVTNPYYIVDHSGANSSAEFKVFQSRVGEPVQNSDPVQGSKFQIDHILELQFVCKPFDSTVPQGNIAAAAWNTARDSLCITGTNRDCGNIARILSMCLSKSQMSPPSSLPFQICARRKKERTSDTNKSTFTDRETQFPQPPQAP